MIHGEFRRLTDKTENIPEDDKFGQMARYWKNYENKLSAMTKIAREIKVLIKKLYGVWKSNEKKKERKKLTNNNCDKEIKLCDEMTELLRKIYKLEDGTGDPQIQPFKDYFNIHKWDAYTQTEDKDA